MGKVISVERISREPGYLYFVGKNGAIHRVKRGKKGTEQIGKEKIARRSGYLYYVNKNGQIEETKMSKGKRKVRG